MSKDISDQIKTFVRTAYAAAKNLAEKTHLPITYIHVQDGLQEALKLDVPEELLTRQWTKQLMLEQLADTDFRRMFPVVLAEVRLPFSVIPAGTRRRIEEITVRMNGEVWRIHQNDADPFPSNPHAHNVESGAKMDLSTGEKRRLLAIREQLAGLALPPLAD